MDEAAKELIFYLPSSVLDETRRLSNENILPMISYTTSFIDGYENVLQSLDVALETGYRWFDVFPSDKNEEEVGLALEVLLPKHKLTRKDIYLTTKISPQFHGGCRTRLAVLKSRENLRTEYIDVCLLQWPGSFNLNVAAEDNASLRQKSWLELIDLYEEGIVKNIGVCHFNAKHLDSLLNNCGEVKPVINQVEFHPRFPQKELLLMAREHNILLQSACFENCFHDRILTDQTVIDVAKTVGKTPAQIILKWNLNYGVAVIIQSTNPKVISENFHLFDFILERPEMEKLNKIKIREKYMPNPISIS